ncbi:MAG: hypothetical protein IT430_11435 [Phycisphaerales bacterium]|nr:hypothetical protein [Phycisphaerales bacterium]
MNAPTPARPVALLLSLALAPAAPAQIIGSAHDFTSAGWAQSQSCLPCHTSHNAAAIEINGYSAGRLWNHALPAQNQVYTTYEGDLTRDEALDSYSLLCMGCHDGTVALDAFGDGVGTQFISGDALVGTDLTAQHPVGASAVWPNPEPSYLNPRSTWENQSFGGDRMGRLRLMVVQGAEQSVVSCATCHEPHNRGGNDYLLRIDNTNSQMCLTCHSK